jgi:DNA-binding NarL/FixJ family response regulator
VVVLELDARGNIWLVLAVNDLVPDLEAPLRRNLRNLRNGQSYLFVSDPQEQGIAPGSGGRGERRQPELTKREIEVLGLVAVGLASREIADRLYISAATVNNHRQRILEKMGARNSSEAVRYASRLGIL